MANHQQLQHPPPRRLEGFQVAQTELTNQNQNSNHSNHPISISPHLLHATPLSHFFGSPPGPSALFTDAELIDSLSFINNQPPAPAPPPAPASHSPSPAQLPRDQHFPFALHHLSPSPSHYSLPRSSPLTQTHQHSNSHHQHAHSLGQAIYSPGSAAGSAGPAELFPEHAMALDEPLGDAGPSVNGRLTISSSFAPHPVLRTDERAPLAASVPTYLSSHPSVPRHAWEHQPSGDGGRTQDKLDEGSVCSSVQSYGFTHPQSRPKDDSSVACLDQQKEVLSEKRRRRRESHNAVERRRRDNINDRIAELAALLPSCMLEPTGAEVGGMMMVNEEAEVGEAAANASAAGVESVAGNNAQCKPNKGIILAKSVEYIKHLKDLLEHQVQRNLELEKELERSRNSRADPHVEDNRAIGGGGRREAELVKLNVKEDPQGRIAGEWAVEEIGFGATGKRSVFGEAEMGSRINAEFGYF